MAEINTSPQDTRADIDDNLQAAMMLLSDGSEESKSAAAAIIYRLAMQAKQNGAHLGVLRSTLDACNSLLGGPGETPSIVTLKTMAQLVGHIARPADPVEQADAVEQNAEKTNSDRAAPAA